MTVVLMQHVLGRSLIEDSVQVDVRDAEICQGRDEARRVLARMQQDEERCARKGVLQASLGTINDFRDQEIVPFGIAHR